MKIMLINSVYGQKSTGNLIKELSDSAVKNGHEVICVYGRGKKVFENNKTVIKTQSKFLFLINAFLDKFFGSFWSKRNLISTNRIKNIILNNKPDIINIHQLYGYYLNPDSLLAFLEENNIKTIITLHDFTIFSGKCGYPVTCNKYLSLCYKCPRLKEYPKSFFFDKTKNEFIAKEKRFESGYFSFIAVSKWLQIKAQKSAILRNSNVICINNGINTNIFNYKSNVLRLDNEIIVVSTNFSDPIKGSDFLIETINKVLSLNQNVIFKLVGKYSDKIKDKIKINKNVICFSHMDQKDLSSFYSEATMLFIPSVSETFSLPTAESLCCGTPVYGPKGCGGPEYLFNDKYCDFSTPRNYNQMALFLLSKLNKITSEESSSLSEKAKNVFSNETMYNNYLSFFERCIKNEEI